ncbi:MAG TPA: hypothetical protein VF784_09285 [Anaerolineales bacterium]
MRARKTLLVALFTLMLSALVLNVPLRQDAAAQQPTGSIPTVTGTPVGAVVSVDPSLGQIDVYAGPSSFNYPAIGVLLTGIKVPALGRARGDDNWIMIRYEGVPGAVGWVYALYVSLTGTGGVSLPLIDIPPTPTPAWTPTINPTLAAAYLPAANATRLPTFTPPAPLAVPTFVDQAQRGGRLPVGLVIFGFAVVGVLGTLISFLRGR